jgi:hypothetical protein
VGLVETAERSGNRGALPHVPVKVPHHVHEDVRFVAPRRILEFSAAQASHPQPSPKVVTEGFVRGLLDALQAADALEVEKLAHQSVLLVWPRRRHVF